MTPNTLNQITAEREAQALTLQELSVRAGYHPRNLNRYFKKPYQRMNHETLDRVCEALGVSWDVVIKKSHA